MSVADSAGPNQAAVRADRGDTSEFTRKVNHELLGNPPFDDRQDFEDAARGLRAAEGKRDQRRDRAGDLG